MADNANRKPFVPADRDEHGEAAADDPLMKLFADLDETIAPYDASGARPDGNDPRIDLEEALETGLAPDAPPAMGADVSPAPASDDAGVLPDIPAFLSPRQAPRPDEGAAASTPAERPVPAMSLEEELADMLGEATAAPVFARAAPVAPARPWAPSAGEAGPDADPAPGDDRDLEAELAAAFGDDPTFGEVPPDARAAERSAHDAGATVEALPADATGEAEPRDEGDGAPQLDPFDELAAIMGLQRGGDADRPSAPAASASPQARSFEDMEADFHMALARDLPDIEEAAPPFSEPSESERTSRPDTAAAPPLDTVDMSGFEGVAPVDFEVPELEPHADAGIDELAFADLEGELANALDDDPYRRAGKPDRPADAAPAAHGLDAAGFEAELARGIEFVGHDLDATRQEDGLDLEAPGETAEQAAGQDTRPARRAMVIGLVVAGLAVAGLGGVFALVGGEGALDEGPVLVEADADPVKVEPDDPGGTPVPNQDRAVFADGDGATPRQETLVSTAEEPVDIAAAPADGLPSAVAAGEKSEDRLTAGGTEAQQAEPAIAPIAPRRVRTLIVRPDGTLEERAPAPAPVVAAEAPVAETASEPPAGEIAAAPPSRDEAPIVGEPETVAGLPVDAGAAGAGDDATAGEPAAPAPAADIAATAETDGDGGAAQVAAEAPPALVRRVQTTTATPGVIAERPADQPVNVVNLTPQAPATPAAPAAPAPTVTGGGSGGFTVQLAALPSEEAARTTATRLSQQYGALIAGRGLTIQRAVIEGRGTFYRVRVAADGAADANGLCNRIKTSGGNCFVAR